MTREMTKLLPISFYTSFIIPKCNSVIYKLSTYGFCSVNTYFPRYISDQTVPNADVWTTVQQSDFGSSGPIFLGYAKGFEQETFAPDPIWKHSHGNENGYLNALRAITKSDINPDLCNAATYQAYANLCRLLKIHLPLAHDLGKCCVCYEPSNRCMCYKFFFTCIQAIECVCRTGKYGFCVCDDYPEIFCDLDVIRHFQECVISELLSMLGIGDSEDQCLILVVNTDFFRLLIILARRCDDRFDPRRIRILESFRPP